MDRSGAIDGHHASHMMQRIMELYITSERYVCEDMGSDEKYIRK